MKSGYQVSIPNFIVSYIAFVSNVFRMKDAHAHHICKPFRSQSIPKYPAFGIGANALP